MCIQSEFTREHRVNDINREYHGKDCITQAIPRESGMEHCVLDVWNLRLLFIRSRKKALSRALPRVIPRTCMLWLWLRQRRRRKQQSTAAQRGHAGRNL